jgi:Zn-dependent protease
MKLSLRLFRVRGIDIRVHATFVLVLLFGALQFSEMHGPQGAWFGAFFMCCLFACVVLHELGHSLVAQQLGVRVREIVLLPIGGVARLSGDPKKPLHELLIAVAGPLVNVILAVLGLGIALIAFGPRLVFSEGFMDPAALGISGAALLSGLIMANLVLAVFNMLPALPMDGGRVLRALMTFVIGRARATTVASIIGQALALGVFVFALYQSQLVLMLIGALVFVAAGNERRVTRVRVALGRLTAGEVANPAQVVLAPGDSIGAAIDRVLQGSQTYFPVAQGSQLAGVVSRQDIVSAAAQRGVAAFVAGAMHREVARVQANLPLPEVQDRVMESDGRPVAVFSGDEFVGLLTADDLWRIGNIVATLGRFGVYRND